MLAAVAPVTWNVATWDAGTWISAASPVVAILALGIAFRSARAGVNSAEAAKQSATAAQRSADAAERAAALQEREAQLQAADRHEADGPQFVPVGESVVGDDLAAEVKLRIEGGPGALDLELETDGPSWCVGLSSTRGGLPSVLIVPAAYEPDSVITFYVHISGRPWADDAPAVLAVVVTATTGRSRRRWMRRVSVPVVPPTTAPLAVPPDPDRPPLPEW